MGRADYNGRMNLTERNALATEALDDLKAVDVQVIDVTGKTAMTDQMIVATGTSLTHVRAIAKNLIESAKHAGAQPRGVEGLEQAEWVLVDLGDVVVHIMQAQTRAFYQLEKLWETRGPEGSEPIAEGVDEADTAPAAATNQTWANGPQ